MVHKFTPTSQAMKNPDAKAAVDKEWNKLETIPAWQLDKVKSTKEGCSEGTERQTKNPLCYIDGHMSSRKCRIRVQVLDVHKNESYFKETL